MFDGMWFNVVNIIRDFIVAVVGGVVDIIDAALVGWVDVILQVKFIITIIIQ